MLMKKVDLIINARWIVPVDKKQSVLEHHAIVIHEGVIVALIEQGRAKRRYQASVENTLDNHCLVLNIH